jgi:membrane-associated phospholipid phosphatase
MCLYGCIGCEVKSLTTHTCRSEEFDHARLYAFSRQNPTETPQPLTWIDGSFGFQLLAHPFILPGMNTVSVKHRSWARVVSDLLSPPLVLLYTACLVTAHEAGTHDHAILGAVIFLGCSVLIPFLILAWWVYRGKITDLHMPERNERYQPLLVSLVGSLIGWVAVRQLGDTGGIHLLSAFMVILNLVALVVTFYWQISVHSGIMAASVTVTGVVYGWQVGLLLSPLILLVGAARLKLKRHTPMQVVAGALVGVFTVLFLYANGA